MLYNFIQAFNTLSVVNSILKAWITQLKFCWVKLLLVDVLKYYFKKCGVWRSLVWCSAGVRACVQATEPVFLKKTRDVGMLVYSLYLGGKNSWISGA